ncbi:MAG TPA: aminotransferase class III-fold pyridoxal phosphate-dependent enzyme [Solirubrobacteraceae bacterium]|nr:aminotransferase class III-fold pyridoxal phosphate-dependent enzyme [Solirubrobacteraceae bacterium]
MDEVLTATPPRLSLADAVTVAHSCFGVAAAEARDLGSERDRTFALSDTAGRPVAIMKISNPSEDADVLDMEAEAAQHVAAVDPGLRVALPWRSLAAGDPGTARPGDALADLRTRWEDRDHVGHWVRLYDVLPGHSRIAANRLADEALIAWGETTARLARALRGFTHARARRTMLWDVQHALAARGMLDDIRNPRERELVVRVLDRFEQTVAPVWPRLRAQVVHTDLTVDNTLTDDAGFITGVIDFGDMSFTALITDLASVLDSLGEGREGAELFRMARLVLDGYQRRIELEALELSVLGVMWAARSALTIAISSWRVAQGLEEQAFAERYNAECTRMLATMEAAGWDEVARQLGAPARRPPADAALAERRAAVFGPTMEPLFYDVPVQVASAAGVWITDTAGRRHLDAYNNVPCVGHGHPRVTAAIARQSRQINTHMRYLHPAAIDLAERLVALCPPQLDTVLFVNSGSEANDLAWRMATAVTGRTGALCTAFAYHGITEATAALSPEGWFDATPPAHVETWEPPDTYRGTHLTADGFAAALARLGARQMAPAAAILDGLITSDRIADLDAAYVQDLVRLTHEAGGLWIADEVQAGHGRTGDAMWAFARFGVVPDFVTLGKPMGNGHPVAAVVTRREIVSALAGHTTLFSTFGGNPVSAAAALAVLDVIEDERVLDRVRQTGAVLREALAEVAARHPGVGEVRGTGLAWGIELVSDPATREPDRARARAVRDRLRHRGVLVGTTGRDVNTLKIRPPLAFTAEHVPVLTAALDAALAETAPA